MRQMACGRREGFACVCASFNWNAKYETVYRWLASFIVIYTIMKIKSWYPL